MLIRDFYFEDARRRESKNHKWCIFLCPTQELVFQQAKSAQIFTGVRCVNELEAAQTKAAKIILGCSKRTSNAAVRAELGIQSLRSGRDARKLTWQYRMCGMGEERLPRIVWEAKWANKKRGRQPTEWVKVVEDVWKGLDIDEDETLETEGLQGFKEKISVACAEREEKNLRKETKDKEGLQVYGMLKEGIGFKDYLHGPMDAGTKLKVKFRTGDIGLRERRRRHRTVDEEDDEFKCDCGFECEDRVHVVAECPLYKKEREVYVTELGKIDGTYREMFEAWNREERTVAVLGHRRWVEKAGRDIVTIARLGKALLSHLWQSRKERLAIGDRSCGNNAPSSRGRVVNSLTANACKTKEVLVMTPNALLNLLHRGNEYLSLKDVGVLVFDECHKARKKHPYARVMAFYLDLRKNKGPLPKVHHGAVCAPQLCVHLNGGRPSILDTFLISLPRVFPPSSRHLWPSGQDHEPKSPVL
ncbi:unnamed protein product [Ectocarpus sp. CCAP 1310/34]|nr:unnamed protein product [Ectocarpus sp. CCAP 1310/34]